MKGQPFRKSLILAAAIAQIKIDYAGDIFKKNEILRNLPVYMSRGHGHNNPVTKNGGKKTMAIKRQSKALRNVAKRSAK